MERRTNDCVLFSEQLVVWFSNFPSDLVELRNSSYLKISWLFYMTENNLIRTFVAKFYDKCIDVNSLIGTTNLNDRIRLEIEHHIWGANNFFANCSYHVILQHPKSTIDLYDNTLVTQSYIKQIFTFQMKIIQIFIAHSSGWNKLQRLLLKEEFNWNSLNFSVFFFWGLVVHKTQSPFYE